MTDNQDIRWKQRFSNYNKALAQLEDFIQKKNLSRLEEQGLIKAFEYTYELAWNVIKDYYEYQGVTDIQGSRDAFRLAFQRGLIEDGETWMDMIDSRIQTTHTYNEEVAKQIAQDIVQRYYDQFKNLSERLKKLRTDE
jgi:nucleotidyltransferase substrate binding protein (TIGR01987 family)